MHATHDPDHLLVSELLAPPPLEDARRSLEYWRRRRQALPLYKRSARREADAMIACWQERVRAAERARFERTPLGWLVGKIWPGRVTLDRRAVLGFAWSRSPRGLRLVAGWFVAISLVMVAGAVAALVLLLNALA
jgi:hypothetical protein